MFGNFVPNPIAFQFASLTIRWYGILIATAVLLATLIASSVAKRQKLQAELIYDLLLYVGLAGILGARLYYVVFNLSYFLANPVKIVAVWEGGLAIHGALIGGFLSLLIYLRLKEVSLLPYLDCAVLGLPLAQSIGRWGNFMNQEAFGVPTDLPWKIYIAPQNRPLPYLSSEYFHPTFLYESLRDLFVFLVLFLLFKFKKFKTGEIFFWYLMLYSIGRFFNESLRTDSLMLGPFRAAQVVSLLLFLTGLVALIFSRRTKKK